MTDHKPLIMLFGAKTGIPTLSAARMQRWRLILSAYDYNIEYRKSTDHANADALSRLPDASSQPGDEGAGFSDTPGIVCRLIACASQRYQLDYQEGPHSVEGGRIHTKWMAYQGYR